MNIDEACNSIPPLAPRTALHSVCIALSTGAEPLQQLPSGESQPGIRRMDWSGELCEGLSRQGLLVGILEYGLLRLGRYVACASVRAGVCPPSQHEARADH